MGKYFLNKSKNIWWNDFFIYLRGTKQKDMTTQEFLSENRNEVIAFFNNEIASHWNVTLKNFMFDLMQKFRKISTKEEFTKMDLMGNLTEAKSRLGCFDNKVEVKFDRDAFRRSKAPNGQWHSII